ncbi:MAG: hypothetical protein KF851_13480 [Pirellulaceae bacterium]|nr:hypothetical protein [Pirellulaceae bacterium]
MLTGTEQQFVLQQLLLRRAKTRRPLLQGSQQVLTGAEQQFVLQQLLRRVVKTR